jgi:hypothetical protein
MNEEPRELKRSMKNEVNELCYHAKCIQESCEFITNLSDFGQTTVETSDKIESAMRDIEDYLKFCEELRSKVFDLNERFKWSIINSQSDSK